MKVPTIGQGSGGKLDNTAFTWSQFLPLLAVSGAFVVGFARLLMLVNRYAVDVFFSDHWMLEDAILFGRHTWFEAFFWQHGPHRQGLGNLFLRLFEPLTAWNQPLESAALATLIACACGLAIWLKCRLFGSLQYWDIAIPLFFFTPVQYETVLGANNPAHGPLPLLLLLSYCLAWTLQKEEWKCAGVTLFSFLLLFTGFGLMIAPITPALFFLEYVRHRQHLALAGLAASVLSAGAFVIGYHFDPAVNCFTPGLGAKFSFVSLILFLFSGFVHLEPARGAAVQSILALLAGFALFLIAFRILFKAARSYTKFAQSRDVVISVLLGFSLLFCVATAYGRSCLSAFPASRYLTYMIPAFLGLYFAALSATSSALKYRSIVLLLAFASSGWMGVERGRMQADHDQRSTWVNCYRSNHSIEKCDEVSGIYMLTEPDLPTPKARADFTRAHHLQEKLDFLESHRMSLFRVER